MIKVPVGGNKNVMSKYSIGRSENSAVHSTEPVDIGLGDETQLTAGYRVFYKRPLGSGT